MNAFKNILIAGGCAALLALGTGNTMAQGRGNFDPAQMKQDMMDRLRDQMEIKDDQEWQAIEPKVSKVFDARRDVMAMGFRGMGRGGRQNNNGGGNGGGDNNNNGGDNQRPRRNPFGEPSAAMEARQKAIDDKAPSAEIKAKLAAVPGMFKEKQSRLLF